MKNKYFSPSVAIPTILTLLAIAVIVPASTALAQSAAEENPMDLLAVQVREQGHACESPQSAEMDKEQSGGDENVWTLHCQGISYRIRLIPDMAAEITQID